MTEANRNRKAVFTRRSHWRSWTISANKSRSSWQMTTKLITQWTKASHTLVYSRKQWTTHLSMWRSAPRCSVWTCSC